MFYFGRIRTLVAMATYIFHRLLMVKVKIGIFFCLNEDIWNLFLQKCLLSSPLSFIWLLSNSLNLIGYPWGKKGKFKKKCLKNLLLWLYLANSQVSVYRTIGPLI